MAFSYGLRKKPPNGGTEQKGPFTNYPCMLKIVLFPPRFFGFEIAFPTRIEIAELEVSELSAKKCARICLCNEPENGQGELPETVSTLPKIANKNEQE